MVGNGKGKEVAHCPPPSNRKSGLQSLLPFSGSCLLNQPSSSSVACSSSSPSSANGVLMLPDGLNCFGAEGGLFICRDEDPRPPLFGFPVGNPSKAISASSLPGAVHNMFVESSPKTPERNFGQIAAAMSHSQPMGPASGPYNISSQQTAVQVVSGDAAALRLEKNVAPVAGSMQQLPGIDAALGHEPSVANPVTRKFYAAAVKFCGEAAHRNRGPVFSNTNLDGPNNFSRVRVSMMTK